MVDLCLAFCELHWLQNARLIRGQFDSIAKLTGKHGIEHPIQSSMSEAPNKMNKSQHSLHTMAPLKLCTKTETPL